MIFTFQTYWESKDTRELLLKTFPFCNFIQAIYEICSGEENVVSDLKLIKEVCDTWKSNSLLDLRVCIFHCECPQEHNQKNHQIAYVEISKLISALNLLWSAQGHEESSSKYLQGFFRIFCVVSCCDVEESQL